MFCRPSPVVFTIALFAAPQSIKAWRYDPNAPENVAHYGITTAKKLEYISV